MGNLFSDPSEEKLKSSPDFRLESDNRKRHDSFWCILFILFTIGWFGVSIVAFSLGNPKRLVFPRDSYGNLCGADNRFLAPPLVEKKGYLPNGLDGSEYKALDMLEKSYLFYPTPWLKNSTSVGRLSLCVKECPNSGSWDSIRSSFKENVDCPGGNIKDYYTGRVYCSYSTESIFRRCVPFNSNATVAQKVASEASSTKSIPRLLLGDVAKSWDMLLLAAALSLIFCIIYTLLLRKFAGFMVWSTLFIFITALIGLIIVVFRYAYYFQQGKSEFRQDQEDKNSSNSDNKSTIRVIGIILIVILVIFVLIVIWLVPRIKIAIGIIREAAAAIKDMPYLLLFPVCVFFFYCFYFSLWTATTAFLASSGTLVRESDGDVDISTSAAGLQRLTYYNFFQFLWTTQFLIGFAQVCVAGSAALWYWTRDKSSTGNSLVIKATMNTLRYNLGSIALGSFLIALVQAIRIAVRAAEKRSKNLGGGDQRIVQCIFKCLKCFTAFLERVTRFITRNAYIIMGSMGYSFCHASRRSYSLIYRNIVRVATVNVFGDFLLWIGKHAISLVVTVIIFAVLSRRDNLLFFAFPVFICYLIAYFTSGFFMAVYEMTIDTLLLSFFEDEERHGSDGSELYATETLKSYLSNHRKEVDDVKQQQESQEYQKDDSVTE